MINWIAPRSGTYKPEDVCFMLEESSAPSMGIEEKERAIRAGTLHYSECISEEAAPSAQYLAFYEEALVRSGKRLAKDVNTLAHALAKDLDRQVDVVLASLARAGTPIGVLLKRALERLGFRVFHYGVSIVRDKGLDLCAMDEIAHLHKNLSQTVFVDGWTGKGTISRELRDSLATWAQRSNVSFDFKLAVIADPCGWSTHAATREDYLIPNALLNATVSGCISRTTAMEKEAMHGARFFAHLAEIDKSRAFVETIDAFAKEANVERTSAFKEDVGLQVKSRTWFVEAKKQFNARTDNHLKPGIPETTRVLLRRKPRLIAVKNAKSPEVAHLLFLANQLGVGVQEHADMPYSAVGVIDGSGD